MHSHRGLLYAQNGTFCSYAFFHLHFSPIVSVTRTIWDYIPTHLWVSAADSECISVFLMASRRSHGVYVTLSREKSCGQDFGRCLDAQRKFFLLWLYLALWRATTYIVATWSSTLGVSWPLSAVLISHFITLFFKTSDLAIARATSYNSIVVVFWLALLASSFTFGYVVLIYYYLYALRS